MKNIKLLFFGLLLSVSQLPLATVSAETTTASPKPLFHIRLLLNNARNNGATTADVANTLNMMIPSDISQNVSISLSNSSAWNYLTSANDYNILNGDNYLDFCKRFNLQGTPFFFEISELSNITTTSCIWPATGAIAGMGRYTFTPAQIEEVFKSCNNCLGTDAGEVFWGYDINKPWLLDILRLCKKYNKRAIVGEGIWKTTHWPKFLYETNTLLVDSGLGKYLIPCYKNTKNYATYHTISTLFGAWATNTVGNIGFWNDVFVWCYSSFGNANEFPPYVKADNNQNKYPYTFFLREWLMGAAMGATLMTTENSQWTRDGVPDANFEKYLHPFIKAFVDHNIVPRKEAVLAKVKVMINPFGTYSGIAYSPLKLFPTFQNAPSLWQPTMIDPFGVLYKNSYGFSDEASYNSQTAAKVYYGLPNENIPDYLLRENIPNESKYYFLPVMPSETSTVPTGITKLNLSTVWSDAALKSKLDSYYTAPSTLGKAFTVEVDNSFFVLNSHENTDIDEPFSFQLGGTQIQSMTGIIPFQNIVFGKREGTEDYWFQTNGYTSDGVSYGQKYVCVEKPTTVSFTCSEEPSLTVENENGIYVNKTWNSTTKMLTLVITHTVGAVNFRITGKSNLPLATGNILDVDNCSKLNQNYPNPVKANTTISYQLEKESNVKLKILNTNGQVLTNLVDSTQQAGTHIVKYNAKKLSNGIYIYQLWIGNKVIDSKTMIVSK